MKKKVGDKETAYILSSKANYDWLMESKKQLEENRFIIIKTKENQSFTSFYLDNDISKLSRPFKI